MTKDYRKETAITSTVLDAMYWLESQSSVNEAVKAKVDVLQDYISQLQTAIGELQDYVWKCESGEVYWVDQLIKRPKQIIEEVGEILVSELEMTKNRIMDRLVGAGYGG